MSRASQRGRQDPLQSPVPCGNVAVYRANARLGSGHPLLCLGKSDLHIHTPTMHAQRVLPARCQHINSQQLLPTHWHAAAMHRRPTTVARAAAQQQVDPWKQMVDLEHKGETVTVEVKRYNKGGLIVKLGELEGFLPYQQLCQTSMRKGHTGNLSYLVGQKLKARIMAVDTQGPKPSLVFSEKQARRSAALQGIKVGEVRRGVVRAVEEYGVFVELPGGVTGLVHKSEISWDPVRNVMLDSGLVRGSRVDVLVVDVDPVKCRLSLSIKQLSPDPLKQTLDTLQWGPTSRVPAEIQRLVDNLNSDMDVDKVVIGRQAQDARHVAQELQVFLTRASEGATDGHMVVARLGSVLQELQVVTKLDRDQMKAKLQTVAAAPAAAAAAV